MITILNDQVDSSNSREASAQTLERAAGGWASAEDVKKWMTTVYWHCCHCKDGAADVHADAEVVEEIDIHYPMNFLERHSGLVSGVVAMTEK